MGDSKQELLELIERIYASVDEPGSWPELLECLAKLLSATAGTLNLYNLHSRCGEVAAAFKIDPEFGRSYRERFAAKDIWINSPHAGKALGRVVTSQMLVSDEELTRSEFYQEFLRPQNIFHLIGSRIQSESNSTAVFSLFRPKSETAFGAAEATLLECLLPHILRAVQVFFRLQSAAMLKKAVADVLDQLSFGVILVTTSGKPLVVNRRAAEIAAERDGLIIRAERVEASSAMETAWLLRLISEASSACSCLSSSPGGTLRLTRPSFKQSLVVLVAPISRPLGFFSVQGAGAVLFVTDPTMSLPQTPEVLTSLFELTRAETKLCQLLIQGKSVGEAAEDLVISLNTARTHLKRIFDKTGTHRQSELVVLLTRVIPGIREE